MTEHCTVAQASTIGAAVDPQPGAIHPTREELGEAVLLVSEGMCPCDRTGLEEITFMAVSEPGPVWTAKMVSEIADGSALKTKGLCRTCWCVWGVGSTGPNGAPILNCSSGVGRESIREAIMLGREEQP